MCYKKRTILEAEQGLTDEGGGGGGRVIDKTFKGT